MTRRCVYILYIPYTVLYLERACRSGRMAASLLGSLAIDTMRCILNCAKLLPNHSDGMKTPFKSIEGKGDPFAGIAGRLKKMCDE